MKITLPNANSDYKQFLFKSGENHVTLSTDVKNQDVSLFFHYAGDSSLIELLMLTDAIRRQEAKKIDLVIPYFPGARQDRVCNKGEALSVKVYADLINNQKYDSVSIFDPHSDVTPALVNNVKVTKNHNFIKYVVNYLRNQFRDEQLNKAQRKEIEFVEAYEKVFPLCLVAPDAGSMKKIFDLSKFLGGIEVVRADKIRDVKDGRIIDTQVFAEDLGGKICLVVDDIVSGARTFLELSKKLKEKGADKVYLAVSHHEGVCTEQTLKEAGIDGVFTTDSLGRVAETDFTKVANVFSLM